MMNEKKRKRIERMRVFSFLPATPANTTASSVMVPVLSKQHTSSYAWGGWGGWRGNIVSKMNPNLALLAAMSKN